MEALLQTGMADHQVNTLVPGSSKRPNLEIVEPRDFPRIFEFIVNGMSEEVQGYAAKSLREHVENTVAGLDDGRMFFALRDVKRVVGVCGLHHYSWTPSDVCWASWFVVRRDDRQSLTATRLAVGLLQRARALRYRRLYVETYSEDLRMSPIAGMLRRCGVPAEARLTDYFGRGADAVIFNVDLIALPPRVDALCRRYEC